MAMRRGGYGRAYSSGRVRPLRSQSQERGNYPVYEDIQPTSEWKVEDEAVALHVFLPGFLKEQIRYTIDAYANYLMIYGERPLVDFNRRLRFNTTYAIPKDTNLEGLTIQFERGILKFTFPKLITSSPSYSTSPDQKPVAPTTSQEDPKRTPTPSPESSTTTKPRETKEEETLTSNAVKDPKQPPPKSDKDVVVKEKVNIDGDGVADKIDVASGTKEDQAALNDQKTSKVEVNAEKEKEEEKVVAAEEKNVHKEEAAADMVEQTNKDELMVNMWVSALVLLALWLDLCYTFR